MNKAKTVAFSGYRPNKLPDNGLSDSVSMENIKHRLCENIIRSIGDGYDTFIVGMDDGFDMLASEEVIKLKDEHNLNLICVLPFERSKTSEQYDNIIQNATEVITLSNENKRSAYYVRNEYMVDNSSRLICYYDGIYGGTEYTIEYAQKQDIEIINIWEEVSVEIKPPKMIDNKRNGIVIDEIKNNIRKGSKLNVISAYFTIYAYAELKKELSRVDNMRFIFTEPTFINKDNELSREYYLDNLDNLNEKNISGNQFEIKLRNEMRQSAIAKECAKWIEDKVEFRSLKIPNTVQPRLVYIENKKTSSSISGTVDFTSDGLGITKSDRIDSNMCVYGNDFTMTFLNQFNDLWKDSQAVEDVKTQVLEHMKTLGDL